jgi:hypothetical protein
VSDPTADRARRFDALRAYGRDRFVFGPLADLQIDTDKEKQSMPVAVDAIDLLELLVSSPPADAATAALHRRLWAAVEAEAPTVASQFRRLLDAADGTVTEFRRLDPGAEK